jgi:hypothetical protein
MFSPIIEAYTEHNKDGHDTDVIATFDEFKGESAIIPRPTKLQLDNQVSQYNKLIDATTAPPSATTTVPLSTDNPKMLNHKKTISSMTFNEIVNGYSKWLAEFMNKIMETFNSIDLEDSFHQQPWLQYISTFMKVIQFEIMKDTNSTIYGGITFILVSVFIHFVFISS